MLAEYQLKIADLYNFPIGNVKNLVPNFFDKKRMCYIRILATLLETRIKTLKSTSHIRIESIKRVKKE